MRLDKILANRAVGSRREVHKLIKQGRVSVNGTVITEKDFDVVDTDRVTADGADISLQRVFYIKFHKPAGYITAIKDAHRPVVMDLLPPAFKKLGIVPVGRLDKDTEGLLLLTNDGVWGHAVINGRKSVPKVYEVVFDGTLTDEGIRRIGEGIRLGDGSRCKPAVIRLIAPHRAHITVEEGKYHQIKRMIGAAGGNVTYLKRLSVGDITLDRIEKPNMYAELTAQEINGLKK